MAKRTKKPTHSIASAVRETGYSRAWISRLCQHGKIGTRIEIPEAGFSVYRISEKDILRLKALKKQGIRNAAK